LNAYKKHNYVAAAIIHKLNLLQGMFEFEAKPIHKEDSEIGEENPAHYFLHYLQVKNEISKSNRFKKALNAAITTLYLNVNKIQK
jgi:hypothetical protein